MSGRDRRSIVASVADVDESGNVIEGTDRYASSVAPSSPVKEQPNTGRARREKAKRNSSSPITTSVLTDSDSTVHPQRDALKKSSRDKDKSVSSKKALMASRPPVKHAKTATGIPKRDIEASYYGVEPTVTPATSRPRAQTRPSSCYGPPPRPPPSNARFYASQTPGPPLPSSFPPPPPQWMGGGPVPMPPFGSPSPAPLVMQHHQPGPPDYFARPLESRFGGASRPQSSMGFRPPRAIEYEDEYAEPIEKSLARRPSTTRKASKNDEDRRSMPPPPRRPASARPTALAYRPPPPPPTRRKVDFDDNDVDADLFGDLSPMAPLAPGSYEYTAPIPFRPRPSFGADLGYDTPDYHTEVAGKGRRNSYYGGNSGSSGSAYEDKMRQASRYQDDITGGPQLPLTAEALRKAGRSGASSRSTRSSGSHDESEYRQSATTRTTRSTAPNDEDFTIRVKGSTTLKFGNAEMQCEDGAEINISSRGGNPEVRAVGSDRSSYIDQDDRRTRVDIPQSRARAASRAKSRPRSFSRPFPKYDATPKYDGASRFDAGPRGFDAASRFDTATRYDAGPKYDLGPEYDAYSTFAPPLPPPYPEYPSSYSSRHGDGYFGA
ncbi:hypothetical protein NEMBOFW57_005813 [Staphylotrichum longicolle]|uniref:Uncharacterized protein n=1 Tax=Staphylotrichum longicolle TaxID=669026 RepID=A0AAD4HYV6_9PEZI|nr:hypothetical protein NEMBOFW57_005813 [Staphylotrichum longicolle]